MSPNKLRLIEPEIWDDSLREASGIPFDPGYLQAHYPRGWVAVEHEKLGIIAYFLRRVDAQKFIKGLRRVN